MVYADDVGTCSVNVKVVYVVERGLDADGKNGVGDVGFELDVAGLEPRRLAMTDSAALSCACTA